VPTAPSPPEHAELRTASVGCIGMTVSNLDRSVDFYEQVLSFQKTSDLVFEGAEHAALEGIRGAQTRRDRLDLGTECIELSEPLGGTRRPIPTDSRSNDLWFQHVAIVVRDMDLAYAHLEEHHVAHVSEAPQTLPAWNPAAGNLRAFYFKDPDGHTL